jgi:UDP-N-acetylglucosamine diphosphorylase/glucosamine-1-phosphate N-acetyltransferase
MKAVVLAAGEGSRMWPLAEKRPKHLLPVGGKTLVSYALEALADNSIKEVFLVVGYKSDLLRSEVGDGDRYGLQVEYLEQPRWTGTASALGIAYDAVGREPFLALYGDLWINSSALQAVIECARDCSRVMGVVHVTDPAEYGVVKLDGNRLAKISEKPGKSRLSEGWVNTGIYVLDGEVFEAIKKTPVSRREEYELTTSLQYLLDQGKEIGGAVVDREDWMDVGRPWDLIEANERALAKLPHRVAGTVEQGAVLKGPIWLEESAIIKSGSYVEGPVYIGKDARIGPNSRIRPSSSIGDEAMIGTSCEVKNSIIMKGTTIPHLSYVGDSVIGEDCNLGAGTITANIRFDEEPIKMRIKGRPQNTGRKKLGTIVGDGVHIGINVTLFPGVCIGSGSSIWPGAIISKDVPSERVVVVKQTTITKPTPKRKGSSKRDE